MGIRVTQAPVTTLEAGDPDLRVTQAPVLTLEAGNPNLRVTQCVVLTLEPNVSQRHFAYATVVG